MNKELRNSQALEDSGSVETVFLVSERSEGRLMKRVVWSNALHQQFVNAVNQLGIDKAKPKRILELMNVPGLSRDNVASHLQKFRMCQKGQTQMLMKNLESWKDLQVSDIDQHRRA